MAPEDAWPISDVWYYHDFHEGQTEFMADMEHRLGQSSSLEEFCNKAQLLNYDSHRAMLEAWNSRLWDSTSGILLWMSHPAWPSMIWQTYSWDYETTGSFYGCRKACEPVHIQKNLPDNRVVIVNASNQSWKGATATYTAYGLDGRELGTRNFRTDIPENGKVECFTAALPDSQGQTVLERLTLKDRRGRVLSVNDYWTNDADGTLRQLNGLPQGALQAQKVKKLGQGRYSMVLRNNGQAPLVAVKLNVRHPGTGERVLPAYVSDGYFNLLPGESRTVEIEIGKEGSMEVTAEAYNLRRTRLTRLAD